MYFVYRIKPQELYIISLKKVKAFLTAKNVELRVF